MDNTIPEWVKGLSEEDWQFVKRLLLASGSLKDVAQQYGISYPTVRIRLDRLIEKVQILDSQKPKTKFHQKVQLLVAEGRLDLSVAKILLKTFEESSKQ
jgi:hypothetical protein